MFKCTHCEKWWDEVDVENHKPVRLKENQVCPDCGDGVLRPIITREDIDRSMDMIAGHLPPREPDVKEFHGFKDFITGGP